MKTSARAVGLGCLVAVMLPVSLVASSVPAVAQSTAVAEDPLTSGGPMDAGGGPLASGQSWEAWGASVGGTILSRGVDGASRPNPSTGLFNTSVVGVTADGTAELQAVYPAMPANGVDVAKGRPATMSSTWSTFTAANLVDGNDTTRAVTTNSTNQWVQVDLGTLAPKVFGFRTLGGDSASTGMVLQSSPDASNWTTRFSGLAGLGETTGSFEDVTARYWRLFKGTGYIDAFTLNLWAHATAVVGVAFRSNTDYLVWLVGCGPNGLAEFYRGRPTVATAASLGGPAGVAGPACGATHDLKVVYTGSTYQGYVGGTLAVTWTDSTSTVPITNTGAGVTIMGAANTVVEVGVFAKNFKVNGGVVPEPGDLPLPDYKCGRTIRDVGGGQYFADLEAFNLFPVNVNTNGGDFVGYSDHDFRWRTSFGSNLGAGQVVFPGYNGDVVTSGQAARTTIALPPTSEMPPGGWTATFYVTRQADANTYGDWTFMGGGDWHELDQDGAAGPEPTKPWWMTASVWNAYQSLPPSWREGTVIGPGGVTYTGNTGDHWLPPTAVHAADVNGGSLSAPIGPGWSVVTGTCTVTLNPLQPSTGSNSQTGTGQAPPSGGGSTPTTTTTPPGSSTTTTRPAAGHDNQGEDGSRNDCSAGFLGRMPVIGGAFELAARVVCALKQLLVELFVPDNLESHTTQLRQAWADSKATSMFAPASAVVDLGGAFSAGYAPGGCSGPTVTMPAQLFGGFEFKPLDACSPPMSTFAGVLRTGLSVLLWVGGAFFLFRIFMVISGLGEGIE